MKKKIIGYTMIASVFVSMFLIIGLETGFAAASIIMGGTAIVSALIITGVHFIVY